MCFKIPSDLHDYYILMYFDLPNYSNICNLAYLWDTGVDIHEMLVSIVGIGYAFTPGTYGTIKEDLWPFLLTRFNYNPVVDR